jgi:hypothetical protein
MEDVEMRELLEGVAAAGSWAVWMGVFSRSLMKLLTAGGLSYKRARGRIVTGKISAIISECRCAVAKVRHERAARESAEAMAERRRILELEVRKYHAMDKRSVGSGRPPLDQLLANGIAALPPSGSTSGGNATRRRVARKRWSERTGSSVLELPLLRGVLDELLL